MDRHDRLTTILELLAGSGSLSVDDAVRRLGASAATIRRDFDHLAEQQLLTRTRGGAVAAAVSYDLPLSYKVGRQSAEKERIAAAIAGLVSPGSVVGLNGGTTTTSVARLLATDERFHGADDGVGLTVVTNALNIAGELAVRPHIKVVVVGGVVRARSYEIIGPLAARVLDAIELDLAVLGVDAVDPVRGAMAYDESEAATNALLAADAGRVLVAADSSKIEQRAFAHILSVDAIDTLVTDAAAAPEAVRRFADAGVQVIEA